MNNIALLQTLKYHSVLLIWGIIQVLIETKKELLQIQETVKSNI